ncbi:unnamed protein product [Thlaspi arvense]|uniref:RBR-type E3 ubiquitin transferase n=1 Tax=Thlaspi arvense TaxID=13288 RepID=A0AAU9SQX0_THLAR|nr:unnamed protein product [Thlaspi arvense]
MDFLGRDSDSDYAFRLQMEEALAASLSSRSRTPQRPPSPPVVATSGVLIAVEGDSEYVRLRSRGGKTGGEGNSRGKGKTHVTFTAVRTDDQNPNFRGGNSQNASGYLSKRLSPVVRPQETVRPAQLVGEGSSKVNAAAVKFSGNVMYRLYSKGLLSEENGKGKMTDVVAGFGFAICDERDNLLFDLKGPLIGRGTNRQGAEIAALSRGLFEASKLGIKHIAIFCDFFPIFQFVRGSWTPKQKKISMLMDDLQRIRQQFAFSQPVLVAGNEVKFAYKLARESIVAQVTPHEDPRQSKVARKEECLICYNDTVSERMFSTGVCGHRFCVQCVKQHVEVRLLHGLVPNCPHDDCKSELVIDACGKLLTPKLSEMWTQRIKENAIPATERVYCPYPRCSALMSKTKISESAKSLLSAYPTSGVRRCVECRGLFCMDCKVPWHGKLSCTEYKKLHPNPPADDVKLESLANNKMWRQCGKCKHMIELAYGCNHMTCRCGHEFCYNCGGEWNKRTESCDKSCPNWDEAYIIRQGNNYFDDDSDDEEDYFDDDDDDEEDYDSDEELGFGHGGFPLHFGQQLSTNDAKPEEPFDPFFDLPDGVLFTPDMLSPRTRARLYPSDDSDEVEGQAEETGRSHLPPDFGPFGLADEDCPYFGKYGKYTPVYDSDGYEIEDYTNPFHPDYPHF